MLPSSFKTTMDSLESLLRFTGSAHNLQATSLQAPRGILLDPNKEPTSISVKSPSRFLTLHFETLHV